MWFRLTLKFPSLKQTFTVLWGSVSGGISRPVWEREGGGEREREGGREGGRERGREGGREGRREGGREGGKRFSSFEISPQNVLDIYQFSHSLL